MYRFLPLVLLAFSLSASAADPPADEKKKEDPPEKSSSAPLMAGKDLPGAFHPFNVTGSRKGHFHCPVSENGLNAGILVISRDLELTDPVKDLLQQLDNVVEKNPNVKMGVCWVYIPDELPEFTPEMFPDIMERKKQADKVDDKREELSAKIEEIAKQTMLKNVVLALTNKNDLKAYSLPDNATYTIVIYHKYEVQAVESLERDKLTAEKVSEIIKLIGDKLGARRK